MNEIAIASVPIQEWEEPFDEQAALEKGTIFAQLQKPFFIEEEMEKKVGKPKNDREGKMLELQQVTFFLIDITLFLDTHPHQQDAKMWKEKMQAKRKQLMQEFAQEHYPLTMDCAGEQDREVVPWEGGIKHVAL